VLGRLVAPGAQIGVLVPFVRYRFSARTSDETEPSMTARAALRSGDAGQALELLDSRERTGNELEAEATLLRSEALAALVRQGEASELAARFVRDNPNSALDDRAKRGEGRALWQRQGAARPRPVRNRSAWLGALPAVAMHQCNSFWTM